MNLTEKSDVVNWPLSHYVFIEKAGPFQETAPKAWESLHQNILEISKQSEASGYMSLYKIEPQMIYRAGVVVESKPANLPAGFQYVEFEGGEGTLALF